MSLKEKESIEKGGINVIDPNRGRECQTRVMWCINIAPDGGDLPGDIFENFFHYNCHEVCPNLEIPSGPSHLHPLFLQLTVKMMHSAPSLIQATSTTVLSVRSGARMTLERVKQSSKPLCAILRVRRTRCVLGRASVGVKRNNKPLW